MFNLKKCNIHTTFNIKKLDFYYKINVYLQMALKYEQMKNKTNKLLNFSA